MDHVSISSHAELQALQDRSSDGRTFLKLVSLESVRTASDSYALLRSLIERRPHYWRCPQVQMDLLSLVAGMALELHKIKHDLLPLLVAQEGGFLKDLLRLRNSAVTLVRLWEDAEEIVQECVVDKDVLLEKVENVGAVLEDTACQVLKGGTRNFAWLRARVPFLLNIVDDLLSTPVHFADPAVSCQLVTVVRGVANSLKL